MSLSEISNASTVVIRKRRHLVIVPELNSEKRNTTNTSNASNINISAISKTSNVVETVKPKSKPKRAWVYEKAKSGRSTCKKCKQAIEKDTYRIGYMTFYPHKNIKWFHTGKCATDALKGATMEGLWYKSKLNAIELNDFETLLEENNKQLMIAPIQHALPSIVGRLDMPRFATALNTRYNKFRSFKFGLPQAQQYSKNWRWRCLLATMLVCNTHETAMLAFIEKFFKVYATPEALDKLRGDKTTTKAWMDFGDKIDLRHIGKKMAYVLRANKTLLDEHDGDVPNNRETLQKMNGVGRHVASITMAWCHQEAEFGIDVHVKRILQRWGYITEEMKDIEVEEKVKELIPSKEIGHFSRSFVDHGQTVCGYTPDCQNCYLKHSCPTAAKHLEW